MENNPKKYNPKGICYKKDCNVVITGFRWNDLFVCKTCKLELTEELYRQIKDKNRTLDDIVKEIEKMWDDDLG